LYKTVKALPVMRLLIGCG